MDALGVDLVVYKFRGPTGTIEEESEKMEKLTRSFEEGNLNIIVNAESGNWRLNMFSTDGHNCVQQPDNLYLFRFSPSVLKSLNRSSSVLGILYDKLEHSPDLSLEKLVRS